MTPSPRPTCWLASTVEVRESQIAGAGLFATEDIAAGALVSRLGGTLVSTAELRRLFDVSTEYVDTIAVTLGVHLVLPPNSPGRFGNHSCEPNLWWDGPYDLVARRDIDRGEELTNDYSTSTVDAEFVMRCACRASCCRRTVRGSDAWRVRLDRLYDGHVVPVVAEEIARHTDH